MPLSVKDGMGAWVKDFQDSNAPQFKGKSDKERREMAIAAYLSAKRGDTNEALLPTKDVEKVIGKGAKPIPKNAKNSDGTKTKPMSRAKQLAKKARDAQPVDEIFAVKPSLTLINRRRAANRMRKSPGAMTPPPKKDLNSPEAQARMAAAKAREKRMQESTNLGEAHAYSKAANALRDYANKHGGMDKKDFHTAAKHLDNVGKAGIMQKGQHLAKMNAHFKGLDTDVRDRIHITLRQHGVMEAVQVDEVSSSLAKKAMKKRIERQAASYTTQASYNRKADKSRAKRDALLKKADALPDHHKPRSSGGDLFKGSAEHEKLTKKAQDHNVNAHYYSKKAKEAEKRGDEQGNKIGRSQDRAYPKLGKALKANPDHYRANRIADTQVKKMRDKHFATTADYDIRTGKEIKKAGGKQHSQYPKEETVLELKKSTLGSYVKKAAQDAGAKAYSAAQKAMSNPDQSGKDYVKSVKRQKGIAKATDRLTREAKSFDDKFRAHLKFATSKSPAVQAYMKKRAADRDAMNKELDPNAAKKGYALSAVPPERAFGKARKKGMSAAAASQAVGTASRNRGRKLPK